MSNYSETTFLTKIFSRILGKL